RAKGQRFESVIVHQQSTTCKGGAFSVFSCFSSVFFARNVPFFTLVHFNGGFWLPLSFSTVINPLELAS
ncbi:MAG: hypothetical protein KHX25_04995, partial [Firmicutes bacterium]|nr:hypothetical protein [Bacillota bacterium]